MAEFDGAPRVHTLDVGLACCAVEVATARAVASTLPDALPGAGDGALPGADAGPREGDIEVLVVAGTVTDAMAPLVRAEYDALHARVGDRLRVLSFGSCANTGGPYWDSYAVTKGIDQLLPVDAYVPGCPPRPELLRAALAELR